MIIFYIIIILSREEIVYFIHVFQLLVTMFTTAYRALFNSDTQLVLSKEAILRRSASCLSVMSNISNEVE